MKLPELPRVLKKREANWTTDKFIPWCKKYGQTFAWEVKHTRGKDYLNFNEVKPNQIAKLLEVRHGVYVRKNPDMGETTDFDGQCLVGEPAYIIIKYPLVFVLINIDTFVLESKRSKRKSLTSERAKLIAFKVVNI
jgi:hypothetical protein